MLLNMTHTLVHEFIYTVQQYNNKKIIQSKFNVVTKRKKEKIVNGVTVMIRYCMSFNMCTQMEMEIQLPYQNAGLNFFFHFFISFAINSVFKSNKIINRVINQHKISITKLFNHHFYFILYFFYVAAGWWEIYFYFKGILDAMVLEVCVSRAFMQICI